MHFFVFDALRLRRILALICVASGCALNAHADSSWLPAHFSVPSETVSPDGRYGVMLPDSEGTAPNKLVDMKTGRVLAELAGEPGWTGNPSMRWGEMAAKWSADSSTLCWMQPGKWFLASYVVLKLKDGRVTWQMELMKAADREMLSRTEEAAPLNFAIAKLDNDKDGSAYPEGFAIDVSQPQGDVSLPLTCQVSLTSNTKADANEPEENGVRAWLTMTVGTNGSLTYSDFKVKAGTLSPDAAQRLKANAVNVPLVDTDEGKAMLFPGLGSRDGRFAIGWTVEPAQTAEPPVDWSHWDATDPDKVLRLYNWRRYAYMDGERLPYKAVDFVLDTQTGKTVVLPTEEPNWPGKKDGWVMLAHWYRTVDGRQQALIENSQDSFQAGENLWLVDLGAEKMGLRDITKSTRKAINDLLRERRPEVAAEDFLVSCPLKPGEEQAITDGFAEFPFVAKANSSDQKEFQLSGTVKIRLTDGSVLSISSDQKRLDPFVTNKALKKADETLNTVFQAALRTTSSKDAQALLSEERKWITQRDADATQAVNILPDNSTQQACEDAREKSLLNSTNKRLEELKRREAPGHSAPRE